MGEKEKWKDTYRRDSFGGGTSTRRKKPFLILTFAWKVLKGQCVLVLYFPVSLLRALGFTTYFVNTDYRALWIIVPFTVYIPSASWNWTNSHWWKLPSHGGNPYCICYDSMNIISWHTAMKFHSCDVPWQAHSQKAPSFAKIMPFWERQFKNQCDLKLMTKEVLSVFIGSKQVLGYNTNQWSCA